MSLISRVQCEFGKVLFQLCLHPIALALLVPAANAGLAEAQMIVGFACLNGKGIIANDSEALLWLQKICRSGERAFSASACNYVLQRTRYSSRPRTSCEMV